MAKKTSDSAFRRIGQFIKHTPKEGREGIRSAVYLFPKSYELIRKNLKTFAVLYSVSAATTIAATLAAVKDNKAVSWNWEHAINSGSTTTSQADSSLAFAGTFLVLVTIAMVVLEAMANIAFIHAAAGKKVSVQKSFKTLFSKWLWFKLVVLSLIVGLMIAAGLILLVLPGLFIISRTYFASYAMIDQDISLDDSLTKGWELGVGNIWKILGILLVTIALGITMLIPYIGLLVSFLLGTAYAGAGALRYFELKKA